jgi:murein L,D-transpeptidase YafK
MNSILMLFVFSSAFILSLSFKPLYPGDAVISIPSSRRSREAIRETKPRLVRELEAKDLICGSPIFIRVFKESDELEVWLKQADTFALFKSYKICSYSGDLGPKVQRGDLQSPEGFYFVTPNRLNPNSRFHLSFDLGYPNEYDRYYRRTGSALMIHGDCVSIGCYAMTDKNIEEIFTLADAALRNGQRFFRVHIFPFRMTVDNMNRYAHSQWSSFWQNLKEGYDVFESTRNPPDVGVRDGRYVFR